MVTVYWIQIGAIAALFTMIGSLITSLYMNNDFRKGREKGWSDAVEFVEKSGQVKIKTVGEKPKR